MKVFEDTEEKLVGWLAAFNHTYFVALNKIWQFYYIFSSATGMFWVINNHIKEAINKPT